MYSRIRRHFSPTALTLSVIALVLALAGGAIAAGGLTKAQEKQVKKLAKQEAQKYANSNPGAPGQPGAPGKDGTNGTNGTNGKDGTNGTNGKSVVSTNITTVGLESHCVGTGGTRFQIEGSATKEFVCNGEEGEAGEPGEPGEDGAIHPGETLPSGASETGSWSIPASESGGSAPISFPIPLAAGVNGEHVKYFGKEETPGPTSGCAGGTAVSPKADKGFLCVYTAEGSKNGAIYPAGEEFNFLNPGASKTGGVFFTLAEVEGPFGQWGTWAVTAP